MGKLNESCYKKAIELQPILVMGESLSNLSLAYKEKGDEYERAVDQFVKNRLILS